MFESLIFDQKYGGWHTETSVHLCVLFASQQAWLHVMQGAVCQQAFENAGRGTTRKDVRRNIIVKLYMRNKEGTPHGHRNVKPGLCVTISA